jgi:hypothetical protein
MTIPTGLCPEGTRLYIAMSVTLIKRRKRASAEEKREARANYFIHRSECPICPPLQEFGVMDRSLRNANDKNTTQEE